MLFLSFCEVTSVVLLQSRQSTGAHSSLALLGGVAALITAIATLVGVLRSKNK
jgi:hypothetical protein